MNSFKDFMEEKSYNESLQKLKITIEKILLVEDELLLSNHSLENIAEKIVSLGRRPTERELVDFIRDEGILAINRVFLEGIDLKELTMLLKVANEIQNKKENKK